MSATGSRVTLSWVNPDDPDFSGMLILRTAGSAARSPVRHEGHDDVEEEPERAATYSAGDQVGSWSVLAMLVDGETQFVDENVPEGTFTYRLWARDAAGNWSRGPKTIVYIDVSAPHAMVTEVSGSAIGGGLTVRLRWTNPSDDADFSYVKIVRKLGAAPQNIDDGTVVYFGSAIEFIDTDVPQDGTWYYAIFTCDAYDNCMGEGQSVLVTRVPGSGSATLVVDTRWGAQDFTLESDLTANGHTYNFSEMRYWLTNVELVRADDTVFEVPSSYFLMTENEAIGVAADPGAAAIVQRGVPNVSIAARKRESISLSGIEPGTYKAIRFAVGVDPVYNDDLTLTAGELHTYSHMAFISWMWQTSYIFMRLKGDCVSCAAVSGTTCAPDAGGDRGFQFDVGDKQGAFGASEPEVVVPESNYRVVNVPFAAPVSINLAKNTRIDLALDVAKILAPNNTASAIDPNVQSLANACWADPLQEDKITRVIDPLAPNGFAKMTKLADNVQQAFSLVDVTQTNDSSPGTAPVVMTFPFKFGDADLAVEGQPNSTYVDAHGNSLSFSMVRFWLSNVRFVRPDGSEYLVPGSYFILSNHAESTEGETAQTLAAGERETIVLNDIPVGTYRGVRFAVGVDPTYNDDLSLKAGELGALSFLTRNDLWMWRSSYIFSRIKGASGGSFTWDVGGNAHYQEVPELSFAQPMTLSYAGDGNIRVDVDVKTVIDGLDLSSTKTVGSGDDDEMTTIRTKLSEAFELFSATGH